MSLWNYFHIKRFVYDVCGIAIGYSWWIGAVGLDMLTFLLRIHFSFAGSGGVYTFRRIVFQRGCGFHKGTPTMYSRERRMNVFNYNYKRCRFRFKHLKRPLKTFHVCHLTPEKCLSIKIKIIESFLSIVCKQFSFYKYIWTDRFSKIHDGYTYLL